MPFLCNALVYGVMTLLGAASQGWCLSCLLFHGDTDFPVCYFKETVTFLFVTSQGS
jgi:hypothetical protein